MKKDDVEIEREIFSGKKKVILFRASKIVKKFSFTGHVLLPKYLIGKRVLIIYPEEKP